MKEMLYAAFTVTVLVGMMNASAQTTAAKRGGVCIGPFHGDDSVLQCEHIDKVTVEQIYEKSFRVAHVQGDKSTTTYVMLVTEEQ